MHACQLLLFEFFSLIVHSVQRVSPFYLQLTRYLDESPCIFQAPKDSVPEISRLSVVAMIDY